MKIIQPSLASGIWGSSLAGRVDLERFPASLKDANNMYITKYGGASNRPGFELDSLLARSLAGVAQTEAKLIPFQYGIGQNYVLEFTEDIMRVHKDGGLVLRQFFNNGHIFVQGASGSNEWYVRKNLLPADPEIPQASYVALYGNSAEQGTVGSLAELEWDYADNDSLGYKTVYFRLSGGDTPADINAEDFAIDYSKESFWTLEQMKRCDFTQSFDVMYFTDQDQEPVKLSRLAEDNWSSADVVYEPTLSAPTLNTAIVNNHTSPNMDIKYAVSTVGADGQESFQSPDIDAKVLYPWPNLGQVQLFWNSLTTTGTHTWTVSGAGTNEYYVTVSGAPLSLPQSIFEDTSAALTYSPPVKMTKATPGALLAGQWGYGDTDGLGFTTIYVRLTDNTDPTTKLPQYLSQQKADDYQYNVWKNDRGYWTWLSLQDTPYLIDTNISGDSSYTPRIAGNTFTAADNRPRACSLFQQRLMFGGTNSKPQTLFGSTLGDIEDFSVRAPLDASDALEATLDSPGLQVINHLVPQRKLLAFTDSTIQVFDHGRNSDSITPTNVQFRIQDYIGCAADINPVPIDSSVLFVHRDNQRIYATVWDGKSSAYITEELTIYTPTLFENRQIVDMAFQRTPENLLWVVLDDGSMLTMTYQPSQQMNAWARHTTAGEVQAVATIFEQGQDYVYISVERETGTFIERLHSREELDVYKAFYLDSALTYSDARSLASIALDATELVITYNAVHGLTTGDYVKYRDVTVVASTEADEQYTSFNDKWFLAEVVDTTSIQLKHVTTGALITTTEFSGDVLSTAPAGEGHKGVSTVGGWEHLANQTITVMADGMYLGEHTVSATGFITLKPSTTGVAIVHAGLPYEQLLETNRLEYNDRMGTTQSRTKNISRTTARVKSSRGGWLGPLPDDGYDEELMLPILSRDTETWREAEAAFTGDREITLMAKWTTGGRIRVEQRDPLPFTLLALVMEVEIEENQ